MASGYLVARVPELRALDAPFAVRDRQAMLESLDGALGRQLAAAVARQTQLRVLAFWDNGFRHISNRLHPIRGVADCAGMRIRTLDSASYVQTFEALGFVPVVTDASELRAAVASGHVTAQENPLVNFMQFDIWQHHPFVSLTHHLFGVALLVAPAAWLDALVDRQRQTLLNAARLATTFQRAKAVACEAQALLQAQACGVQIVAETDLRRDEFLDATAALRRAALATALEPVTGVRAP
jgi:TRAP-type C4-dicarboxylate transport system substrate-binding protein